MFLAPGLAVSLDNPTHRRMVDDADTVRVGDTNRSNEITSVVDPVGAGHLPVAIQGVSTGPDRMGFGIMTFGQNRGDPGSYRTLARLQGFFALNHGAVADCNACDIRDGIVGTGVAGKIEPQRSSSGFGHVCGFLRCSGVPSGLCGA